MRITFDVAKLLAESCEVWGVDARIDTGIDTGIDSGIDSGIDIGLDSGNGWIDVHTDEVTVRVRRARSAGTDAFVWVIEPQPDGAPRESRAVPGLLLDLRKILEPGFEPGRAFVGARYAPEDSK